jgi:hypothetical protein
VLGMHTPEVKLQVALDGCGKHGHECSGGSSRRTPFRFDDCNGVCAAARGRDRAGGAAMRRRRSILGPPASRTRPGPGQARRIRAAPVRRWSSNDLPACYRGSKGADSVWNPQWVQSVSHRRLNAIPRRPGRQDVTGAGLLRRPARRAPPTERCVRTPRRLRGGRSASRRVPRRRARAHGTLRERGRPD